MNSQKQSNAAGEFITRDTRSSATICACIAEEAWQEVDVSAEKLCLTTRITTLTKTVARNAADLFVSRSDPENEPRLRPCAISILPISVDPYLKRIEEGVSIYWTGDGPGIILLTDQRHFFGDQAMAKAGVPAIRYVLRCTLAASLAYVLSVKLRLPNDVWAPISALIVSQESLAATHSSVIGRLIGTIIGAMVALVVEELGARIGAPLLLQIAIAVAVCAALAKERPAIRVCLWTCPIVLLTASSNVSPEMTAVFRGNEVILGALIGGIVHCAEDGASRVFVRLAAWGVLRSSETGL
jgi:hypothetical protein